MRVIRDITYPYQYSGITHLHCYGIGQSIMRQLQPGLQTRKHFLSTLYSLKICKPSSSYSFLIFRVQYHNFYRMYTGTTGTSSAVRIDLSLVFIEFGLTLNVQEIFVKFREVQNLKLNQFFSRSISSSGIFIF